MLKLAVRRLAVRRLAVAAAVLAVLAVALPAAAIPYCWNCTCTTKCTTRCWDGSGEDVCGNWLCIGHCEPPWLSATATGQEPNLLAVAPVAASAANTEACDALSNGADATDVPFLAPMDDTSAVSQP